MARKTGLGKGLGAFFGDDVVEQELESKKEATVGQMRKAAAEKKAAEERNDSSENSDKENSATSTTGKKAGVKVSSKENSKTASKTAARTTARTSNNGSGKSSSDSKSKKSETKAEPIIKEVIKTVEVVKTVEVEKEKFLNIALIEPNMKQPRKNFREEDLAELTDSIRQYGIIQPIVVQETENGGLYEIIAGERRYRAAKAAGLTEVPVIVKNISKQQAMEIALIENVQRMDLNPIEEAKAYQMLISEYDLTQDEVAQKVSKSRSVITNTMRLLKLAEKVQYMVIDGEISNGHARALLGVEDSEIQIKIAEKIVKENLSVREVEKLVKNLGRKPREKKEIDTSLDLFYQRAEEDLKVVFGTKVCINKRDNNKGKIEIEYYSSDELERLLDIMKKFKPDEESIG